MEFIHPIYLKWIIMPLMRHEASVNSRSENAAVTGIELMAVFIFIFNVYYGSASMCISVEAEVAMNEST